MKKIMSVVLCAAVVLTTVALFPMEVKAGDGGSCGNLKWEYSSGVLTITGNGVIPSYENDYDDTNKSYDNRPWHNYIFSADEIVIGEGVTAIGELAFEDFEYVTKITIADSVTDIRDKAFRRTGVKEILLPKSLQSIGVSAFGSCASVRSVIFKKAVDDSYIAGTAFNAISSEYDSNKPTLYLPKGMSWDYSPSYPLYHGGFFNLGQYPVKEIQMDKNINLKVGESAKINCQTFPDYAYDSTLTWISFDEKIATVNSDGVVTAKSVGTTIVNASFDDWTQAVCTITVTAPQKDDSKPKNPESKGTEPTKFADVDYNSWMGKPVNYVVSKGLMKGTSGNSFEPKKACSREMMIQILYNAENSPSIEGKSNPFKDVKKGAWYYNAVVWGVNLGATKGISSSKFGLGVGLTREQVAQFLYNYAKICGKDVSSSQDLSSFKDAGKVSGWAKESVKWAVEKGIISGKKSKSDGRIKLDPKGSATRVETAQMIMNYLEKD